MDRDTESLVDGAPKGPVGNLLLDAIPRAELDAVLPHLEAITLELEWHVYKAGRVIEQLVFPVRGVVSMVSDVDGATVEIGTVGYEGVAGLAPFLGASTMPTRAFIQVAGFGYRMPVDRLPVVLAAAPSLERVLRLYMQTLFDQVAQAVACNRLHSVEQRCARWLLMTHDRVGDTELPLKQQFLAEMLGVQRPVVSVAQATLKRERLIAYSRGRITVLDRAGLESRACACYGIIRRSFEERLRTVSDVRP